MKLIKTLTVNPLTYVESTFHFEDRDNGYLEEYEYSIRVYSDYTYTFHDNYGNQTNTHTEGIQMNEEYEVMILDYMNFKIK